MCGITGVFRFGQSIEYGQVKAFNDALTHRGPDAQELYFSVDKQLALGHCRLSIVDLDESANQPFLSDDKRYALTFNGEIYNFFELRKELQQLGAHFRTDSDTEVLLNAYQTWGKDCLGKLNGMWAFAIWDNHKRELFLSRDRFGVKPLYFASNGNEFAFSSEQKAFKSLWGGLNFCHQQVSRVLMFPESIEGQRETLYQNIKKVLPGEYVVVTPQKVTIEKWWNTYEELRAVDEDYGEVENLLSLFESACDIRTRTDVKLATSLSGGLDSSAVTSKIAQLPGIKQEKNLKSFIGSFKGTEFDEFRWAKSVVDHHDVDFTRVNIHSDDAVSMIDDSCIAMEDLNTMPAIGQWLIYQNMHDEGYKVSLEGHAGDELLAGYVRYIKDYAGDLLNRGDDVQALASSLISLSKSDIRFKQKSFLEGNILQLPLDNHQLLDRTKGKNPVLLSYLQHPGDDFTFGALVKEREHEAFNRESILFQRLYEDFHYFSLPNILKNYDRLSMANSVEVRSPFLDYRFVLGAFKARDNLKISRGLSKFLIRDQFTFIPRDVRERNDKLGFNPPIASWLRDSFGNWLSDMVSSQQFVESAYIDGRKMKALIIDWIQQGRVEKVIPYWPLINLFLLERAFK